jgi:molecular chaperone GrpE
MSNSKKHPSPSASAETPPDDDSKEPQQASENSEQTLSEEQELQEPIITIQDYEQIQEELEQARLKVNENFEGWQRERADFLNYKKRIERDQAQSMQNLTGNIVKKYLVIVDDMERALKNKPQEGEAAAWAAGIELIYRKLKNILEAEGVKPILAEGQQFDPTVHEAISHEDNPDYESGQVIEVVQQGYTLGDRVLRPALVRVAR